MSDPDRERRQRSISRMSMIAFVLAFIALLLGIIYNRPTPALDFISSVSTGSN